MPRTLMARRQMLNYHSNAMELHEYQKRLANFIAMHTSSIISVDMGLGKTAAVLAWMDWYARTRDYNVSGIIVAPKRVAENNWQQEAYKWGLVRLASKMTIVKGDAKKRMALVMDASHPVKIISRDNLRDIKDARVDFLVLDELTSFKNVEAVRTKSVMSIRASVYIGLTGTFLANGAIDIYGQASAVHVQTGFNSYYAWRGNYFRDALAGAGLQFHKWVLRGTLDDVLRPIESNIFTLTAEDYLQIPDVTETTHKVDVGREIRDAIDGLDAFLAMELDGELLTFNEAQKFAKLQTLCNGFVYQDTPDGQIVARGKSSPKLEEVANFAQDCAEQGESVLLFYAFREEETWLTELLKERGLRVGSVRDSDFLRKWEAHDVDVLMAHPASAGHGLNLQHGGRIIVWSSLTYNYELFAQGNARLARQGQKRNVQIHYFVADKTCEERAVSALTKKQAEQRTFLNKTKQ